MKDMEDVKSVRNIIDELGYAEKVPKGSELAQEIGNRCKLHLDPAVKEQRPNDTFKVNYYPKDSWDQMRTIVRVTVAEEFVQRATKRPTSLFKVDHSIFGSESDKNATINQNDKTRAFLFPLLSFEVSKKTRLKQAYESDDERTAYKERIINLLNLIWMPANAPDIDLDAEPYKWCKDKGGNIDKVIADLTEIVCHRGKFAGTTLEEIAAASGYPLLNKALRSLLHYMLEDLIGRKVYKRVLRVSTLTDALQRCLTWPNDDWPAIVLRKDEAEIMEGLFETVVPRWYEKLPLDPPEPAPALEQSNVAEESGHWSETVKGERPLKQPRRLP